MPTRAASTAVTSDSRDAIADQTHTLLQRLLMPRPGDPHDVRRLYVDEHPRNVGHLEVIDRLHARLPGFGEVSFATYFNAFPASYWRRWTTVDQVELRLQIQGRAHVHLYRSTADATRIYLRTVEASEEGLNTLVEALDLEPFEDGGWYWFDVVSENGGGAVLAGGWFTRTTSSTAALPVVGVPTHNRPSDCLRLLSEIASDKAVLDMLAAVFIVDQGQQRVSETAGIAELERAYQGRLHVIEQGNLGGSGGYARVMQEALDAGAQQIIYMDDDIAVEPESILRAVAFSRLTKQPMLVGAQMLDFDNRSKLRAMGEVIDTRRFLWREAPGTEYDHDLATHSMRETKWLHRRVDVDYNGWWTCLIPREVAVELGLPLPFFIKWDDAEYCLRAARAGFVTTSVPGIAVWHMSWWEKEDDVDWHTYFYTRNRLIVTALYGPARLPAGLLRHSARKTMQLLFSLQYSTVALRNLAVTDFCTGPQLLFDELESKLPSVQALRSQYSDARRIHTAASLPSPSHRSAPVPSSAGFGHRLGWVILRAVAHSLAGVKSEHHQVPQLNIPAKAATWRLLSRLDGATVATRDGRGVTYRIRDRRLFTSLLSDTVKAHSRLLWNYRAVRRQYRMAHDQLSSRTSWDKVLRRENR